MMVKSKSLTVDSTHSLSRSPPPRFVIDIENVKYVFEVKNGKLDFTLEKGEMTEAAEAFITYVLKRYL